MLLGSCCGRVVDAGEVVAGEDMALDVAQRAAARHGESRGSDDGDVTRLGDTFSMHRSRWRSVQPDTLRMNRRGRLFIPATSASSDLRAGRPAQTMRPQGGLS
jgi:hypothetical protein